MTRKCHVRFGGGRSEKARQRDLAGRLPDVFDQWRHSDPLHDELHAFIWQGFEQVLLNRFFGAQRIATPSWENLYERTAWQMFLGGQGYESYSPGCFVKELGAATDLASS